MNKAYRALVETLFRIGFLRVVVATGEIENFTKRVELIVAQVPCLWVSTLLPDPLSLLAIQHTSLRSFTANAQEELDAEVSIQLVCSHLPASDRYMFSLVRQCHLL